MNINVAGYCDDFSGGLSWVWVFMIIMIIMIILCSIGIVYICEKQKWPVEAAALIIALFFGSFLIFFGSECVELNSDYSTNAYCGPAGEGGGTVMIVIGCLMILGCIFAFCYEITDNDFKETSKRFCVPICVCAIVAVFILSSICYSQYYYGNSKS